MTFFEANGVWKVYESTRANVTALRDIDISVEEGEFVTLVGPSGCGKTTLLNLVAGFEVPTKGTLTLAGSRIERPDRDRGVVFQDHGLFPWLSLRDNVAFGPRVGGRSRASSRRTADEYLALVGLGEFSDSYPRQVSGGMAQRCAIARALATSPAMLLMDEPFAALDVFTRAAMQLELTRIWEATRKTVLFVTHSIEEAVVLSDRVIVMAPRPGTVVDVFSVGIPRPRDAVSHEVTDLRRKVATVLERAHNISSPGGPTEAAVSETAAEHGGEL